MFELLRKASDGICAVGGYVANSCKRVWRHVVKPAVESLDIYATWFGPMLIADDITESGIADFVDANALWFAVVIPLTLTVTTLLYEVWQHCDDRRRSVIWREQFMEWIAVTTFLYRIAAGTEVSVDAIWGHEGGDDEDEEQVDEEELREPFSRNMQILVWSGVTAGGFVVMRALTKRGRHERHHELAARIEAAKKLLDADQQNSVRKTRYQALVCEEQCISDNSMGWLMPKCGSQLIASLPARLRNGAAIFSVLFSDFFKGGLFGYELAEVLTFILSFRYEQFEERYTPLTFFMRVGSAALLGTVSVATAIVAKSWREHSSAVGEVSAVLGTELTTQQRIQCYIEENRKLPDIEHSHEHPFVRTYGQVVSFVIAAAMIHLLVESEVFAETEAVQYAAIAVASFGLAWEFLQHKLPQGLSGVARAVVHSCAPRAASRERSSSGSSSDSSSASEASALLGGGSGNPGSMWCCCFSGRRSMSASAAQTLGNGAAGTGQKPATPSRSLC